MAKSTQFLNEKKIWSDLIEEAKNFKSPIAKNTKHLNNKFTIKQCGISLDFSRQNINSKIFDKLILLAKNSELTSKISEFSKDTYKSEQKHIEALHMLLRAKKNSFLFLGKKISNEVDKELKKFLNFAEDLRGFKILGWNNLPIKNVVVLGLGGSVLGPKLATQALKSNSILKKIKLFFLSNPDCCDFDLVLTKLKAHETLFLIQSKSLKTPEISILKAHALKWMKIHGCSDSNLKKHFSVVTANLKASKSENYFDQYTFQIWDWIGGRFSVWSSIGLPLAISIGEEKFREFLEGAQEMDEHFLNSDFSSNLPLISSLLSVWNRNFLNLPSYVVVPYTSKLDLLVEYIQQLDMESLGKNIHTNGAFCKIDTGQIVWGGPGIEGQHAYFQLIHQGKTVVPVDFYGLKPNKKNNNQENMRSTFLLSTIKAQADALFFGDKKNNFDGNRPSSIFLLDEISPRILGSLLAMQEHRVFTMASIWNINAFDQPGVELGKKLLLKNIGGKFE